MQACITFLKGMALTYSLENGNYDSKQYEKGSRRSLEQSMVARTGFEPVISALRGRRPKPLDERAIICKMHWLGWRESNPH